MRGLKLILVLLFSSFFSIAQQESITIPEVINGGELEYKESEAIQWANKVISFSSEYSSSIKSASQILEKPNVLPTGGESPCAWTIKKPKSDGIEHIRVGFNSPIKPIQVAIAESYKPGAIEEVIIYGKNSNDKKIIYKTEAKVLAESSRMLNIFFDEPDFDVYELELKLNSKINTNFEIDAIGISSIKDTLKARINIPYNVKYIADKEPLGKGINTEYDELAPIISADGKTIYFVRKNHPDNFGGIKDEDDIWFSQFDDKEWSKAVNMGSPLNNEHNNFIQSISPDGHTILLGNIYVRDGRNVSLRPGASLSHRTREGWSFPIDQRIREFRNNSEFANYFLAANGRYLLMAIESNEGYGGLDLHVSFKINENVWSKPINLGPVVNTAANENSPFLAADGVTLYYSTSGISGYGKDDIFVTRRLDETWQNWSEPINMGMPINSSESDSKFSIPASGNYAYFSSKEGAIGKNDIFRILLPDTVKPLPISMIKGSIRDFVTKDPIGGALIIYKNLPDETIVIQEVTDTISGNFSLYLPVGYTYTAIVKADNYVDGVQTLDLSSLYNFTIIEQQPIYMVSLSAYKTIKGKLNDKLNDKIIAGAKISISTDSLGLNIIAVTTTDENGNFILTIEDFGLDQLYLIVEKENYDMLALALDDAMFETDFDFNLTLNPEIKEETVIEFHNILFRYGSAVLLDTSKIILNRIAEVMKQNPSMQIELSGHTDSRSSHSFNLQLSERRAVSAKTYIVNLGIEASRIVAKGYGKTKLLNHCSDNVPCSEEEHAVNRRIEVKILKM